MRIVGRAVQRIDNPDEAGVGASAAFFADNGVVREMLVKCLNDQTFAGKIDIDFDTARRLFTLICVLHIKG